MSSSPDVAAHAPVRWTPRRIIIAALAVLLVIAMGFSTKVVKIGSDLDVAEGAFSPDSFGAEQFPKVKASIVERAVDAATLGPAVMADKAAAAKQYGVAAGVGSVIPVKFSGVVGEGKSGIYYVDVPGMPPDVKIRVQTGPAINGTDLRDATGEIAFGHFKNQIEYQNAGAAINNEMKKQVLAGFDNSALTGKTIDVTGAFTLVNPKNWMVTPVEIKVQ